MIALFLFSAPAFCLERESVLQCKTLFENRLKLLHEDLGALEASFHKYRWAEAKIRRLYYEYLWPAREKARDPLARETRTEGSEEEKQFVERLRELERQSAAASNQFHERIQKFDQQHLGFQSYCPEKGYEECVQKAFLPVTKVTEEMQKLFEHIFEGEREYRKAVSLTAGGPEGLYPEDAVEAPSEHSDYYWRFENERHPKRFEEDSRIADLLHKIDQILKWDFPGSACCYSCGPSHWEKKVEELLASS